MREYSPAMAVGIITGTGTYALPGFDGGDPEPVATPWGEALVARGRWSGTDVLHVSRHEPGHVRLSNHVAHRANIAALKRLGAAGVLAVTVCGAVDASLELGSLVCFDDLHFLANRLADGELCTFYARPGDPERGHWIYEGPFSAALRRALLDGAAAAGLAVRDGGCYGHVDGPRFNTRAEIRGLAACGVGAVSQTAGPETVLCGEAELPYALLGYVTDYANGVRAEATPVATLLELMAASTGAFAAVLEAAVPLAAAAGLSPPGVVYRFEGA
jgi:purine nucleoside phosphorylase